MVSIFVDESASPSIAKGLRRRNIDAIDVREVGRIGMTDREQLSYAREKNLIIFTHDDDFIRIVKRENLEHKGIIYCDQRKYKVGEIVRKIESLIKMSPKDVRNSISYL